MKMMVAVSVLAALLLAAAAAAGPALMLERALPLDGIHVDRLKEMDRGRLSTKNGASEFALQNMAGLYFARVKLGNPPKEYSLQFDTGSDIMWVLCKPCNHCPKSTELNFPMELYDAKSSSTSSRIKCSDIGCTYALQTGCAVSCNSTHKQCAYSLAYANGGTTSGYYVSDTLHFDNVLGNEGGVNASALMFFGCSNSRSGNTNGIMGFGKSALSVISQLNARGMSGKVFSHCLKRSKDGGGILVLGEIEKPGFVFTPLVTTQPRYNLNMTSIAVNGKILPINSSLFATSNAQGTIVDSGTTLSYLADGVYDPVITAISAAISPSVRTYVDSGIRYYVSSNSTRALSLFPTVTLYFEDGAAMTVGPQSYLLHQGVFGNDDVLCIGFQRSEIEDYKRTTILGDLVLRDKIFVYNLDNMSIGWVDYDCSLLNTTTPFVASGSMGHHAPSCHSVLIFVGVAIIIMAIRHLDY